MIYSVAGYAAAKHQDHSNDAGSFLLRVYQDLFETYGEQHWWPGETPLEVIVGAVLTQNTSWLNVEKAIREMKKQKLLSLAALKRVDISVLANAIKSSGFFNVKAKRIKAFIDGIEVEYRGNLKRLFAEAPDVMRKWLLSRNGIGRETADSISLYAAGKPVFVVDAYTRRIFTRIGVLRGDEDYEVIRLMFQRALPQKVQLFNEYHALIVRHAKKHCRTKPVCNACPLNGVCLAAVRV